MKQPAHHMVIILLLLLSTSMTAWSQSPEDAVSISIESEDLDFLDEFDEGDADIQVFDPVEPFNRAVFWFNDKVYFYALKPVARAYRIIPKPVRIAVNNFFSNLATPVRLVSSLLQGKGHDSGTEIVRFGVNTTVGVLGLFDPAKRYMNLEKKDEDLGQVLGKYGVGSGFYIVIPFFGPSNARDAIGSVGDYFLDPVTYIVNGGKDQLAIISGRTVNTVSLDEDTYEGIKRDVIDPYLFIRAAYQQHRVDKIQK